MNSLFETNLDSHGGSSNQAFNYQQPNSEPNETPSEFDAKMNYHLNRTKQPLDFLELNIQSNIIPRFNCANHKLNLAVRSAILKHPVVSEHLKLLFGYNSRIRNSIQQNIIFLDLKCRLRAENNTRWASAFLALESIIKAYRCNAINDNNPDLKLPINIKIVLVYYYILKLLYKLNISIQSNSATIGDLIPLLSTVLLSLEKFQKKFKSIYVVGEQFCNLLIQELKNRFLYELNSNIYKV